MRGNLIDDKSIISLIPARAGSKGVPAKNIRLVGGFPLIAYSIIASLMCNKISRTIVTTDSPEIAEIAMKFGAEVPFLRPEKYASDQSGDIEFVDHALNWFEENEGVLPSYIVHLRPTTPFREPQIIDHAIKIMWDNKCATSLRSGHKASESPYKWFVKNEHNYFQSIISGISNEEANAGRQQFPDVYVPDGYVDIFKTSFVLENNILHGVKMLAFESPVCVEVDTEEEIFLLEYQLKKKRLEIYEYLLEHFSELQKQ